VGIRELKVTQMVLGVLGQRGYGGRKTGLNVTLFTWGCRISSLYLIMGLRYNDDTTLNKLVRFNPNQCYSLPRYNYNFKNVIRIYFPKSRLHYLLPLLFPPSLVKISNNFYCHTVSPHRAYARI
jgi:hypothetical protein